MAAPQTIDRYEIRATLGTGAMGSVYLAWDPKLHREVAIKVLRREVDRDAKVRARFQREARAVASLRHPNIVEIYDYSGEESEMLYIVMERLDGDDLFNIVADHGSMPEPIAAAVGHELCLALDVAHVDGIIHRDMKPENVFVSPNGRVVLTDFGIVKALDEESKIGGGGGHTDIIGTPGFMPPELMMNKGLGPYTDVFALGVLLYNIATGELPYEGAGPVEIFRSMMSGEFRDPREHNSHLSGEFCRVVAGTLEPKPRRRTQSVVEVRDGLKVVLAHAGVTDLRDDMREYMSAPREFWEVARQRTARHVLQRIKIAAKDKDHHRAEKLRRRLSVIDPDNEEIHGVTGLMELPPKAELLADTVVADPEARSEAAARSEAEERDRGRDRREDGEVRGWDTEREDEVTATHGGLKLALVAGLMVAVALGGAGILFLEPRQLPAEVPEMIDRLTPVRTPPESRASPPIAAGLPTAAVEIIVRGGPAALLVDGERLGRVKRQKTIALGEGKHVIELRSAGVKLKKRISVSAGAPVTVLADMHKSRISIK